MKNIITNYKIKYKPSEKRKRDHHRVGKRNNSQQRNSNLTKQEKKNIYSQGGKEIKQDSQNNVLLKNHATTR